MKRYQLPERLGGGIVECEEYENEKDGNDWVWFSVGDWMYHCRADALTEVEPPPLPPEPPQGTFVVVVSQQWGDAYMGYQQVWYGHGGGWMVFGDGDHTILGWADVCADGTPSVLIPDPVASAPDLPFDCEDSEGSSVRVAERTAFPGVCIGTSGGPYSYLDPDPAEQVALAILRAVREARGGAK